VLDDKLADEVSDVLYEELDVELVDDVVVASVFVLRNELELGFEEGV
jgi:hypothetical protein